MGVDVDKKEENNNTFGIIFSILSNPLLPHLIWTSPQPFDLHLIS